MCSLPTDSDNDGDDSEDEEDAELGITLRTNQPERELALHIAQTMRDLAQVCVCLWCVVLFKATCR